VRPAPARTAPGELTVARMRWWHVGPAVELERVLFGEGTWTARTFWSELGQLDTRHYVVALAGEQVVGYAGLCDYPDEAWVQTMAVAPDRQGRGVGAQLLTALLAEAARRRQSLVSLEVRAGNAVAQRLYERHGFARTGLRRGYYQPSGEDAVLMTRRSIGSSG
jgi:[ribosomal protein S18]-alanine N-acetyltransferase